MFALAVVWFRVKRRAAARGIVGGVVLPSLGVLSVSLMLGCIRLLPPTTDEANIALLDGGGVRYINRGEAERILGFQPILPTYLPPGTASASAPSLWVRIDQNRYANFQAVYGLDDAGSATPVLGLTIEESLRDIPVFGEGQGGESTLVAGLPVSYLWRRTTMEGRSECDVLDAVWQVKDLAFDASFCWFRYQDVEPTLSEEQRQGLSLAVVEGLIKASGANVR